jgi:hypothetical protein
MAVGVQSAASDRPQTVRRHVFEPSREKLIRSEGERFRLAVTVVSIFKHDFVVGHRDNATIRDRAASQIPRQVAGDGNALAESLLDPDIPVGHARSIEQRMNAALCQRRRDEQFVLIDSLL